MSPRRSGRRRLACVAVVLGLGIAAPAAAAPGVYRGAGADATGDARSDLDVLRASVAYGQATGTLRATIRMGAKPPGDVDVLLGKRQASGACGLPFVTLSTNVAAGTGAWKGSGGRARKAAKVTYANGLITASVTDAALKGRTPSCAMATVYGAGQARSLRDTLDVFEVTDRAATPTTPGGGGGGDDGGGGDGTGGDSSTGEGVDTDGDGIPDDFDGDGLPDDADGDGIPDVLAGGETGGDTDTGTGTGSGADLSVRVYGIPRRLKRGRSYEARIRIRNDGEDDATRLKVRLTRRAGVALSRRVAAVSRVRSGKAITVHVRVRLTSRRSTRTIKVSVSGQDASARTSFRLRRRAGT